MNAHPESSTPAEPSALASQLEPVTQALAQIDAVSAGIAALREKHGGVVFDVRTTKGMKDAIAARAEIREPRYTVERLRKAAKRPILDLGKKLDAEAKRITTELLAIENPIDLQVTGEQERKANEKRAQEEAEAKRVTALQARVDEIRQYPLEIIGTDSAHIETIIRDVTALEIDDSFAELKQQAEGAKATTLIRLRAAHANALKVEQQQRELEERLAAEEAALEARIAADEATRLAREQAQAEAEALQQAEIDRIAQENAQLRADLAAREAASRPVAQAAVDDSAIGVEAPQVGVTDGSNVVVGLEPDADAWIDIVFDGPPGHESGRFVEVKNAVGASISVGEWLQRPDGFWALRIRREQK
jgi:colicin import membrane protein